MIVAVLASTAFAADAWLLSGGLGGAPSAEAPAVILPTWRLGAAVDRKVWWGSATYARVSSDVDGWESLGWTLMPRFGVRLDQAARAPGRTVPFLAASAYTRIGGYREGGDGNENQLETKPGLVLGATGALGLDGVVNEGLSISVEAGLDLFTGKVTLVEDEDFEYVLESQTATAYGALFVNVWM